MSTSREGADRRAELLDRLQQTGDRHDAAELQRSTGGATRGNSEGLDRAVEELRAVAVEVRQMVAEIRLGFAELLAELRNARRR